MNPTSWILFLVAIMVAGVAFHLPWLPGFSILVAVVIGVSALWKRFSLRRVTYTRRWHYRRGFPGETTDVQIQVANKKFLPLSWLSTTDRWPQAVTPVEKDILKPSHIPEYGELINVFSFKGYQQITRTFKIAFTNRGVHSVGPTVIESGDIFGFYKQSREENNHEYLTVFPELLPLQSLSLSADDPFGDRQAPRRLFEDASRPTGIRSYQPGDEFRRIHWPATARTGDIQVKIYQPVSSKVLIVCLNVATTAHPWMGTRTDLLEHLIKVCATLVYHGVQEGYSVGLLSNGCLSHADQPFRIAPGKSPDQLALLLQALASVTPYMSSTFDVLLEKSLGKLPYGATLVIVTANVPTTLAEELIRIKKYRSHTTLISLENTPPPPIPGIRMVHIPFE